MRSMKYLLDKGWVSVVGSKTVPGGQVNEYRINNLWHLNSDFYRSQIKRRSQPHSEQVMLPIYKSDAPSIASDAPSHTKKKNEEEKKKKEESSTLQLLIQEFKALNGYDDVEGWDEANWARHVRPASALLKFAKDITTAKLAMRAVKHWAEVNELSWTLETVVKKFADYKLGNLIDADLTEGDIQRMLANGELVSRPYEKGGEAR